MSERFKQPFQIIRHRGRPLKAQLPDGTWVERQEKLFIPEFNGFVLTADYGNHFIYEIPANKAHLYPGPIYRCTCGSAAGYAGPSTYAGDMTASGKIFGCLLFIEQGHHSNTSPTKWV